MKKEYNATLVNKELWNEGVNYCSEGEIEEKREEKENKE